MLGVWLFYICYRDRLYLAEMILMPELRLCIQKPKLKYQKSKVELAIHTENRNQKQLIRQE